MCFLNNYISPWQDITCDFFFIAATQTEESGLNSENTKDDAYDAMECDGFDEHFSEEEPKENMEEYMPWQEEELEREYSAKHDDDDSKNVTNIR